jgi:hypothetical protein
MAPRSTTNKAKAAGIGASSFLDLKAELTAKEKEVAENRTAGKKTTGGQKHGKVCLSPLVPFFLWGGSCSFFPSFLGLGRNQLYGAGLIRASTRELRGISSSKPSSDRQSKPRTRFWNESLGYTRNSTKEETLGYQKSSMGRYSLM